jgi:hypothetical protein
MQDAGAERRVDKISPFLQSFESYIVEVAKLDHGATPDQVVIVFKNTFNRSMLASAEYHEEMAKLYHQGGETANAGFHEIQGKIYRSIIAK